MQRRDTLRPSWLAGRGKSPVATGVYAYDTDGFERTDALGGTTHRYPATSTLSVIADSCGVRLRWDVLDGRSTTWQICVGPGGWTQKLRDERHTFFGIGDQTTEQALLQRLADRWTAQLRAHAEHWAAVYPMTWGAP